MFAETGLANYLAAETKRSGRFHKTVFGEIEAQLVDKDGLIRAYDKAVWLFLYALMATNGLLPGDFAQIDAARLQKQSLFADRLALCSGDFLRYLASSKNIRWAHFFFSFPLVLFVISITLLSPLFMTARMSKSWNHIYDFAAKEFSDPKRVRDIALDIRPLFLGWMTLTPPFALLLMTHSLLRGLFADLGMKEPEDKVSGTTCLRFVQFADRNKSLNNVSFFGSAALPISLLTVFALGIPGEISSWIYFHTGVDALLGYPSQAAQFKQVFLQKGLYLMPLGWCLAAIFFRSYFTYALTFASREFDIEIYDDAIRSLPIKGWFRDFVFLRGEHIPFQLAWKDVLSIKYYNPALKPMQELKVPACLRPLQKLSTLTESMSNSLELHTDYVEIKTSERTLSIRLTDLTKEQKSGLFLCLRKNAPSIYLAPELQEALVGSSILKEPRYTEIWFDVLNSDSTLPAVQDLEAGSELRNGAYTITERLGAGGQAVIYKALDQSGQTVILKQYQLVVGESLEVMVESAKTFETESTLLGQLSHDGIVRLQEMFYEQSRVYLVLEHVEGVSLRQLVTAVGSLDQERVLDLALRMCDILTYLHGQSPAIVHRDFTPDNILLRPDGSIKLIDFSVAQTSKNLRAGECAGKHAYSPPEQFRGEACPQSDIYALGASLYYLLVGQDPEPITTASPAAKNSSISEALNAIVERATQLTLSERYESVSWMKMDLECILKEINGEGNQLTIGSDAIHYFGTNSA